MVEELCYRHWNERETLKESDETIGKIYSFVHLHSDCENPHYDWREEFGEIERGMKK